MTALMLLSPATPMLFQGQEFAASSPFLFFADFRGELIKAVRRGRREFLTQFPSVQDFVSRGALHDPAEERTFSRCKLDFGEREANCASYLLHQDLLRLRRDVPAFCAQNRGGLDGAVLAPQAFLLRFFGETDATDRLLIVNLGPELNRVSFAEPLLAAPIDAEWCVAWSSEDPSYGGCGTRDLWPDGTWSIPSETALVCEPARRRSRPDACVRRRTA
jgi:maltooligosyltrehalose trehalohydrolase